jgi:hypothetical protein
MVAWLADALNLADSWLRALITTHIGFVMVLSLPRPVRVWVLREPVKDASRRYAVSAAPLTEPAGHPVLVFIGARKQLISMGVSRQR